MTTAEQVPNIPVVPAAKPYKIPQYRLVRMMETALDKPLLDTPERAYDFHVAAVQKSPVYNSDVENLVVLFLNARRRITGWTYVSTGTLDTILVHPREIFRAAIVNGAAAIILMHNHPSGDPTPSDADIKVTHDLSNGGRLLKLEVLDHIIVGDLCDGRRQPYTSLRERGYFYS